MSAIFLPLDKTLMSDEFVVVVIPSDPVLGNVVSGLFASF